MRGGTFWDHQYNRPVSVEKSDTSRRKQQQAAQPQEIRENDMRPMGQFELLHRRLDEQERRTAEERKAAAAAEAERQRQVAAEKRKDEERARLDQQRGAFFQGVKEGQTIQTIATDRMAIARAQHDFILECVENTFNQYGLVGEKRVRAFDLWERGSRSLDSANWIAAHIAVGEL